MTDTRDTRETSDGYTGEDIEALKAEAARNLARAIQAEIRRDDARAAVTRVEALAADTSSLAGTRFLGEPFPPAVTLADLSAALENRRCDHCGAPMPHKGTSWRESGACLRAESALKERGDRRWGTASDRLVEMRVADLIAHWRPGSHDWDWGDERVDLADDEDTERVRASVAAKGIGFADSYTPILLGGDGRVHNGHRRIIVAIEQGIETVHVQIVGPPLDRDRYRVDRIDGALYSAPRKATSRQRCDGHRTPEQHWIEVGDPIVWSALPPDHPELCNTDWQHAAYCAVCAPAPRISE